MPHFGRRSLLVLAARIAAALGFARVAVAPAFAAAELIVRDGHEPFPLLLLDALGAVVLPSELGEAGRTAALRRFLEWVSGYLSGAELNHAYPAAPIARLPESPLPAWQRQLGALDAAARRDTPGGFAALELPARQALLAAQLADVSGAELPLPAIAPHIGLALMAHFFQSPQGTDLAYRAAIGRMRCRPLDEVVQAPRALRAEDLA